MVVKKAPLQKDWLLGVDSWRAVGKISTCPGDVAQLGERCRRMAEAEGSTPFVSTLGFDKPLTLCRRLFCTIASFKAAFIAFGLRLPLQFVAQHLMISQR